MSRSPTDVDLEIGRRIRERRERAGLTQQDLAGALGMSHQQVQKYESGRNRVAASRLLEIALALDVPVTEFLPTEGDRA